MIIKVLSVFLIAFQAVAAECPWQAAEVLFQVKLEHHNPERWLSSQDIKEDLACTRLILEHFYVAQESVEASPILRRLNAYVPPEKGMVAKEFLQVLFSFHQGVYDTHQGYQLGQLQARHTPQSVHKVTISREFSEETIHAVGRFTYFKVGSLKGDTLTQGQSEIIDVIKNQNVPVILDLRGNGGGDNTFAEAAARALYRVDERIPQHRFEYIQSPFKLAGVLNHLKLLNYREIERYETMIRPLVLGKLVSEILPFTWTTEESSLIGERQTAYTSELILLIDGFCASACDTIVEKLSKHPKVKKVGRSTRGALHFGDAMVFELPHSAIWAKIPSAREIIENDAEEGVGYTPDLEVDYIQLEDL